MTTDRTPEIRARREALSEHATIGDWRYDGDDQVQVFPADGGMAEAVATVWGEVGSGEEEALGEFIGHSKDDVDWLLTEVERLRAELAELQAAAPSPVHRDTITYTDHAEAELKILPTLDCPETPHGCVEMVVNSSKPFHANVRYARRIAERICESAGLGAVMFEAANQPGYEALIDMTLEEKEQLPGRFHVPHWDGDGEPNAWLCAVCWDEGTATSWPCEAARKNGGDVFTPTGEFYDHP